MKLDNIENQEIYVDKEKELNSRIRKINDEIKEIFINAHKERPEHEMYIDNALEMYELYNKTRK